MMKKLDTIDYKNIIIAAGESYTDIDVLACAASYHEFLQLQGINSTVVLPGVFNKSITTDVKLWFTDYKTSPGEFSDAVFIIVDISEPDHLAKFIDQEKIIKLFDHHFGYEDYWKERYGNNAIIEQVGACATLIWEEFKEFGYENSITTESANLLLTAIISNTLDFQASVTTFRDEQAAQQLQRYTKLPRDWTSKYFSEQDLYAMAHPYDAVKDDTSGITLSDSLRIVIG